MSRLAKRITESSPKNYGMFSRAMAMAGTRDLIHLELGQPVHDTPAHIKEAVVDALRAGHVHYSDLRGNAELRTALASKLQRENAIDVAPDQVLVTNGLTQASFAALFATINPGDEVILLEPFYPQHIGKIELAGGVVVRAPLDRANDYSINPDMIAPHITPRTRAIILVNPCNPTGRVYSRDELSALADLAIRHDLLVISDEVYEQILFDDASHTSIASLPGMAERTITLFAFTKAYAMDGWRLGYACGPKDLMAGLLTVTSNEVTHVNTFIQYGALAAVTGDKGPLHGMLAEDRRRRDQVVHALNQCPGVTCPLPQGAIYAFPDISGTGRRAQDIADALLEREGVVVEAGSFYGAAGEGHLRVCFGAESADRLTMALERMRHFFNTLAS
ncbi:Arginine--pyruvate transaminase AruH [Komagataeibacter saccharivorans]|uniref:pyridoxal phosphate-dependent aminotransferase n=1 Tax=Komagataeibacter saccharivorans TaxID=265959 RepID=UPI00104291DB|nr:pyridoxal phosphate-dependent aminotransferase [Komagataeibacter saccharivorans]QBL92868.1 Arginine--pyruvate transaminase AruH [Komagataeibacter saccharivorans]